LFVQLLQHSTQYWLSQTTLPFLEQIDYIMEQLFAFWSTGISKALQGSKGLIFAASSDGPHLKSGDFVANKYQYK